jgi:polar amino acid transport system permease protein
MATLGAHFLWLAGLVGFDTDIMAAYGPRVLTGLGTTLLIVALAMPIGALIAYPLAMARLSDNRILSNLAGAYIYFFRGTPLLAQLFLIYAGLGALFLAYRGFLEDIGLWAILREGFYYVIAAFSLNTGAYQAEILRGGIESVPRGQTEAARALGLHEGQIFRKIILPQALIVSLRPYGNELILVVKASSVASLVTVFDVMGATKLAFSRTYDFQVYLWAAVIYLFMVEIIRRLWDALEHRITRHLRRDAIGAKPVAARREAVPAR